MSLTSIAKFSSELLPKPERPNKSKHTITRQELGIPPARYIEFDYPKKNTRSVSKASKSSLQRKENLRNLVKEYLASSKKRNKASIILTNSPLTIAELLREQGIQHPKSYYRQVLSFDTRSPVTCFLRLTEREDNAEGYFRILTGAKALAYKAVYDALAKVNPDLAAYFGRTGSINFAFMPKNQKMLQLFEAPEKQKLALPS